MYLPLHARWFNEAIITGQFPVSAKTLRGYRVGAVNAFTIIDAQACAVNFYAVRGYTITNGVANRLFRDVFRLTPCGSGRRLYALDPLPAMRERWSLHYPETRFGERSEWILKTPLMQ